MARNTKKKGLVGEALFLTTSQFLVLVTKKVLSSLTASGIYICFQLTYARHGGHIYMQRTRL